MKLLDKLIKSKENNVITTQKMFTALQRRNQKRLEEIKRAMGERWLLHPSNHVRKLSEREVRNG